MFCIGDVCMNWFIGVGFKYSIQIMVEPTAVNTTEFTCLESSGDIFFDRDGFWGDCKFWAFL